MQRKAKYHEHRETEREEKKAKRKEGKEIGEIRRNGWMCKHYNFLRTKSKRRPQKRAVEGKRIERRRFEWSCATFTEEILGKRKTRGVLYLGRFVLSASFSRAGWWVFLYLFSSSKRKTHFPVSSFTGNVPQGPVPRNCTKLKPTHSFQSSSEYRNLSMLLRTFQALWQHYGNINEGIVARLSQIQD